MSMQAVTLSSQIDMGALYDWIGKHCSNNSIVRNWFTRHASYHSTLEDSWTRINQYILPWIKMHYTAAQHLNYRHHRNLDNTDSNVLPLTIPLPDCVWYDAEPGYMIVDMLTLLHACFRCLITYYNDSSFVAMDPLYGWDPYESWDVHLASTHFQSSLHMAYLCASLQQHSQPHHQQQQQPQGQQERATENHANACGLSAQVLRALMMALTHIMYYNRKTKVLQSYCFWNLYGEFCDAWREHCMQTLIPTPTADTLYMHYFLSCCCLSK